MTREPSLTETCLQLRLLNKMIMIGKVDAEAVVFQVREIADHVKSTTGVPVTLHRDAIETVTGDTSQETIEIKIGVDEGTTLTKKMEEERGDAQGQDLLLSAEVNEIVEIIDATISTHLGTTVKTVIDERSVVQTYFQSTN